MIAVFALAKLAEIAGRYPDTRITLIDDSTTYTRQSYESAMHTLYEGAGLAVIVVLLFRPTGLFRGKSF